MQRIPWLGKESQRVKVSRFYTLKSAAVEKRSIAVNNLRNPNVVIVV
jgi:hypothetical protein